jgi:hypothetical protein
MGGGIDDVRLIEFDDIARRCLAELDAAVGPKMSGTRTQWARLLFDCVKARKEDQRLRDGIGEGHTFSMTFHVPAERVDQFNATPLPGGSRVIREGEDN